MELGALIRFLLFNVSLERFEVVFRILLIVEGVDYLINSRALVYSVLIVVDITAAELHECLHYCREVGVCVLDSERIRGKRLLLYVVDVVLEAL